MEVKGSGTGCQEEKRLISSRYPVSLPSRKEKRESCQINKAISCEQAINPITWNVLQQKSRENWREKIGEKKVCLVICFRSICSVLDPNGQTTHWYVRRWED